MLDEGRSYDPKAVAILVEAFDGVGAGPTEGQNVPLVGPLTAQART
jgi:hypothetical protein